MTRSLCVGTSKASGAQSYKLPKHVEHLAPVGLITCARENTSTGNLQAKNRQVEVYAGLKSTTVACWIGKIEQEKTGWFVEHMNVFKTI